MIKRLLYVIAWAIWLVYVCTLILPILAYIIWDINPFEIDEWIEEIIG